jgi:MFS family permease
MSVQLLTSEMRSNFRNLYADVMWFGVQAGSTAAFLAVYAARQGANSFQISLLTAGPAIVNLLLSLLAGRWLENRPLIRAAFLSSILQRVGFLAFVPLPWLFKPTQEIWAIVLIILLMSVPGTLLAVAFNAMFADVVPPDWRGTVVGRRNALLALSMSTTSLFCGQLLDRIVFPLNYQIVFGLGALGALMSSYHLGKLRAPRPPFAPRVGQPMGDRANPGLLRALGGLLPAGGLRFLTRSRGKPLLRLDLLRGPFGKFLAAYLLFYTFQYVPLPLFPLFNVNVLHLTDSAISLGSAFFYLINMLVSLQLSTLSARYGHRWVLVTGALLFSHYPLLFGFAQNATLYWVASASGGLVWALLGGGLINRLMERVPQDDRPAHMTLHNLVLNLGILAGSFIGPLLAGWFGLRETMFISAGLRLVGGILLVVWG